MRSIIILASFLILIQYSFSQTGTIKGYIHDPNENQGFPFANISLVDQSIKTITDPSGHFKIDSIPTGRYDLNISFIGYRDTTLTAIHIVKDTIISLRINYPPLCIYNEQNQICPLCKKKDKVIPIQYGLPSKALIKDAKKGKVRLGGCVVSGCDPYWFCTRDKRAF